MEDKTILYNLPARLVYHSRSGPLFDPCERPAADIELTVNGLSSQCAFKDPSHQPKKDSESSNKPSQAM